jgi:hypothetical protein
VVKLKLGPEVSPRLQRTQPSSLDVIGSGKRNSAYRTCFGQTSNPTVAGPNPAGGVVRLKKQTVERDRVPSHETLGLEALVGRPRDGDGPGQVGHLHRRRFSPLVFDRNRSREVEGGAWGQFQVQRIPRRGEVADRERAVDDGDALEDRGDRSVPVFQSRKWRNDLTISSLSREADSYLFSRRWAIS